MSESPTIGDLVAYAADLSAAATKSKAAAEVQHDYVNGNEDTDVVTESGPVPSLAKQAKIAFERTTLFMATVYGVFSKQSEMNADLSASAGEAAQVTDDPIPSRNGWYWKNGAPGSGSWEWLKNQPVGGDEAERLFQALDEQRIPGLAWSVGDGRGAHPLRITDFGKTFADDFETEQLMLSGAELLRSKGILGVVMALLDGYDNCPWQIKSDGISVFAGIDTQFLSLNGINIFDWLNAGVSSKKTDMVMTPKGLRPMYADMQKISTWGSSSLEYLAPKLEEVFKEVAPSAAFYSGSKGGETSRSIAGRLGSVPMLISIPGGIIPETGSVTVTCSNVVASQYIKPFTGTLAGVYGTLSSDSSSFTFTRAASGSSATVANGTPFLPEVGPAYKDGVALLWMGKNDITSSDTAADIASRTDASFDYFTAQIPRVLVFGHFGNSDWVGGQNSVPKLLQVNALHKDRYGPQYIDTLSYLESPQVWVDTGVSPTPTDLTAQAGHCLPPSLTADGLHFNAALNQAFSAFIKNKLISLGWF
ncbi:SGNH/GDSL hydrolase family protein [Pseudomonas putida]|nr:SGNH/GDSL hydrolase family protein [Pseudomonas putida]